MIRVISLILLFQLLFAFANAQENQVEGVTTVSDVYPFATSDGSLYFTSNRLGSNDIFRLNLEGKSVERVFDLDDTSETHVCVSDDNEKIAFTRFFDGNGDIYLYDKRTDRLQNITQSVSSEFHPKFTADGSKVIYNQQYDTLDLFEVIEYDIKTGKKRNVFNDTSINRTFASYNPQQTKVVYVRWFENMNTEVSIANIDGTSEENISNHPAFDGWPAWSPDGKKIVFASDRKEKNQFDLFVYDLGSKAIIQITDDSYRYFQPVWAIDGQHVFTRQVSDKGLPSQIVKVKVESN